MRLWNTKPVHAGPVQTTDAGDLRAAYERGRREERARHPSRPLLKLSVAAIALVGGVVLVMSALHGSFAGGGQSVDQGIAVAAEKAGPTLHDAGQALKGAGTEVKAKAGDLTSGKGS